jgi:hypothetical protein
MLKTYFILLLGIPVVITNSILAQQTAYPFLWIEPTARANGVAGSYTAIANDGNAMYYNPAGLTRMTYGSLEYGEYQLFPDAEILEELKVHFFAATAQFPSIGAFGIGFTYFNLGENTVVDENGIETGTFAAYEWALALGYARVLNENISLGASIKLIYSHLGDNTLQVGSENTDATAFAFDIGVLYANFLPRLCYSRRYSDNKFFKWSMHRIPAGPSLGLSIRNMGPAVDYIDNDQQVPLPQQLRLGLAWNFLDTDILGIVASTDLRHMLVHEDDNFMKAIFSSWQDFSFNHLRVSYGIEFSLFTVVSLSFGKFLEEKHTNLADYSTYGLSVGPETFRISWYRKQYDQDTGDYWDDNVWRIGFSAAY